MSNPSSSLEPGGYAREAVTDAVPLERPSDHGVVTLMVTRDQTDYRALEAQLRELSENHKQACAQLEARIQAAKERERRLVAQGEEERLRVGHALSRARTQLLELNALRNQSADRDGALLGGLRVSTNTQSTARCCWSANMIR